MSALAMILMAGMAVGDVPKRDILRLSGALI